MSNIGPIASIRVKTQVIENCWNYVLANFHNFSESNKIKVALAIMTKDMPTQLSGDLKGDLLKVILVNNASDIRNREERQEGNRVDLVEQARASFSEQK